MSWGLDGVGVRLGDATALDDVTITVEPRAITAVVGGDGAGKTTAARVLVGLTPASSGRVRRPASIGYQPESSGVWRDLTVTENLQLVAGAHGVRSGEAARRIGELLDATDLTAARDRLGGRLSGGMRQKLGVAMALLPDPDLLVLDEPTTGLDPVSRLELWAFLARTVESGTAVLLTTTYYDEAARASSIVALDDGRVLATGPLERVLGAMPGAVFEVGSGGGPRSWRRRGRWRLWSPDGTAPPGSTPVDPDLADAVIAAALARREAA
ncbi:MAG: ABC transporter ATP-binding protein [Acidimicrobiia bacterium]|nr:ABC transporter ATP-binding protein [Acidimicrobiia bacterium]